VKNIYLFLFVLAVAGCADKEAPVMKASTPISNQYSVSPFFDIDLPSTLNLEILKDVPRVVNLKDQMTVAKDQDARGTCTFFVAIGLVEAAVKKTMKVDVNLSEEYLNYFIKKEGHNSKTEGSYTAINLALAIDKNEGFLLESDWPYQPIWFGKKEPCLNFSELEDKAPKECYSHNAPPKEILAKRISPQYFDYHVFAPHTTNEIIEFLAKEKQPMSMTVPLDYSGWADDGTVSYTEQQREKCIAGGSELCGLHEVILMGYDLDKKVFYFKNNWGEKWGKDGFGTIPFDVVDRHVEHYFITAELKQETDLNQDLAVEKINLKEFNISTNEKEDNSLMVKSLVQIENGGLYTYKVGVVLVQMPADSTEENAKEILLSAKEKEQFNTTIANDGKYLYPENNKMKIDWAIDLKIPATIMNSKTITETRNLKDSKVLVRSTLYQFTDSSYKTLKRVYTPLSKK
jgi:hypothetical protein